MIFNKRTFKIDGYFYLKNNIPFYSKARFSHTLLLLKSIIKSVSKFRLKLIKFLCLREKFSLHLVKGSQ